ncbi:MAG: transglycosylase SLT domain-containing protein [Pyrinomonadaceae bacterium MAG19_C2-C3]|nr:transglycosylase SLT domain-containing protein [Pyrinomonadaceae bacterium MAG19_C2-C3]
MKRLLILSLIIIPLAALGAYRFNIFWQHRFDTIIERQARIYRLDPDLVWSVIYEETYFRPWMRGEAEEVGLMQVTPVVAREWAGETGLRELARQVRQDPAQVLLIPERNIQIGCWYLEKISKSYPDTSDSLARILAAYNAGPSRAAAWNRADKKLTESEFINRIDFPTTRAYVTNILARYRARKTARAQTIRAANQNLHPPTPQQNQAAMLPVITRR